MERVKEDEDDIVCLDESFFINDNYQLTTFTFGSQVLELFCLNSASTDFDLTGQLVWPGAVLLNEYLSKNAEMLQGLSVIELGSGVGVTGVLCSKFCKKVVMTDHNDEVLKILKKNIDLHASSESYPCPDSGAEKLEWANSDQRNEIVQRYPEGFDLVLGADICFQQSSIPLLFDTVKSLLQIRGKGRCRFILGYVSRAKVMDQMVLDEARGHGLSTKEVAGTRSIVGNLEGVIYEITL
ncbi:protein N-lysine methyltransferase METTL21A-like [Chenopodium quinoa]|uniref:protein N-lysine methyltransferase METTL21A-like n=1 Tax=Chenopodium quinoa TaxID=63459 RepID=UPI000B791561|nr:protein N-lysine methyltransferase METTL21A-like [Chenopodium quinoa]